MNKRIKKIVDALNDKHDLDIDYDLTEHFNDVVFAGEGSSAVVYSVKNTDKVIRFGNKLSYDSAFYDLVDKEFNNVVNVYYYNSKGDNLEIIVMEKLLKLEDEYPEFYNLLIGFTGEIGSLSNFVYNVDYDNREFLEEYLSNLLSFDKDDVDTLLEYTEFFDQILNGLEELEAYGIAHIDVHEENIMVSPITKELKLIDYF